MQKQKQWVLIEINLVPIIWDPELFCSGWLPNSDASWNLQNIDNNILRIEQIEKQSARSSHNNNKVCEDGQSTEQEQRHDIYHYYYEVYSAHIIIIYLWHTISSWINSLKLWGFTLCHKRP